MQTDRIRRSTHRLFGMESKHRTDGVVRHRLAKDDYVEEVSVGSKFAHDAESKESRSPTKTTDSKGVFDGSQAKAEIREIEDQMAVDDEFEELKRTPLVVAPVVAPTKYARNFVAGFKILSMNMRDATSGSLLWTAKQWDADLMFNGEVKEEIPKEVLSCRSISREILFSSVEEVSGFRLVQRVYFRGTCIEEWFFQFGFVIPGSTNTWQQTIEAAPPEQMLPAAALSGNVVFETSFYDGEEFLCKNTVRLYYV